jgi:hypothetical protein
VQEALVQALDGPLPGLGASDDCGRHFLAGHPAVQILLEGGRAERIGGAPEHVVVQGGEEAGVGAPAAGLVVFRGAQDQGGHLVARAALAQEGHKGVASQRIGRAAEQRGVQVAHLVGAKFQAALDAERHRLGAVAAV